MEKVCDSQLSEETMTKIHYLMRAISELESVGDACYNLARIFHRVKDKKESFTESQMSALQEMMKLTDKKIAEIFKALCDENRIKILHLLQTGEKCACHLNDEINVTQPTMSHHMKVLCDSGIVVGRKEGKWIHYSISPDGAKLAADVLKELTNI